MKILHIILYIVHSICTIYVLYTIYYVLCTIYYKVYINHNLGLTALKLRKTLNYLDLCLIIYS